MTLHVHEAGDGPAILFLHGWTCHGGFFAPQFEALRANYHLLAPDLPGHGKTGRDGVDLSIEAGADAVAELIEARSLKNVVLVGWSMGAMVAWALIARHGTERLAHLVVEDMTPRVLNGPDWTLGKRDGMDAERNAIVLERIPTEWPEVKQSVVRGIFASDQSPDPITRAWVEAEIAKADPTAMAAMWASLTRQDFRALLSRVELPVTLAYGLKSALYAPEVAQWQAEQLTNGQLAAFENSGHAPHLEEPAAFTTLLERVRRP